MACCAPLTQRARGRQPNAADPKLTTVTHQLRSVVPEPLLDEGGTKLPNGACARYGQMHGGNKTGQSWNQERDRSQEQHKRHSSRPPHAVTVSQAAKGVDGSRYRGPG